MLQHAVRQIAASGNAMADVFRQFTNERGSKQINSDALTALQRQHTTPLSTGGNRSTGTAGLILIDQTGECSYINSTAQQLLCYPGSLMADRKLTGIIREAMRRRVLPLCSKSATGTFISGRRSYIYRTLLLESSNVPEDITTAILLERRSRRNENFRRVCQQYKLTRREREALMLLNEGLTSKEIAQRMNISANTVKGFVHLIMLKLGVTTRSGIVGKINCS